MKKVFLFLVFVILFCIDASSQSVVYTGDAIMGSDDFETAKIYLERSRFTVLPNYYSPKTSVIGEAGDGTNLCQATVYAISKTDSRIKEAIFVCTKFYAIYIESDLGNEAYHFVSRKKVFDEKFWVIQDTYKKGTISAVVEYLTDGSDGAVVYFKIRRIAKR
jgi:hypothetical protein